MAAISAFCVCMMGWLESGDRSLAQTCFLLLFPATTALAFSALPFGDLKKDEEMDHRHIECVDRLIEVIEGPNIACCLYEGVQRSLDIPTVCLLSPSSHRS